MKKILFVCTGNTCRSPMALAFFKSALTADPLLAQAYTADSAGISALDGEMASRNSMHVLLEEWEIDITCHRAAGLTNSGIKDSHLLLTMTASQRDMLRMSCPEHKNKIFTLKEFALPGNSSIDIMDPYGGSREIYRKCAGEIKQAIDGLIGRLRAE